MANGGEPTDESALAPGRRDAGAPAWINEVVHQSNSALVAFGSDGIIVYGNPSAAELLHVAPGDLTGRQALDFIHPDDLVRAAANIEAVGDGARPRPGLMRVICADGVEIALDITPMTARLAPPPDGPGDLTVVTLHDTAVHDANWNFLTALAS